MIKHFFPVNFLIRVKRKILRELGGKRDKKSKLIPVDFKNPVNSLFFYHSYGMSPLKLIEDLSQKNLQPSPGIATNFIGVKVPVEIFPSILKSQSGTVEGPPSPGNWHADIAEWASAFHAVKMAGDTFRIIELGCGWGCWLANTGTAARLSGKSVKLIGIEGDANHLKNARKVLQLNGFKDEEFDLFHGVAGPNEGKAIFPNPDAGEAAWGGQAIFSPTKSQLAEAEQDRGKQVLDCYTLEKISGVEPIDLLHIDIQGAEVDFVEGNLSEINKLVRRVLIGTHSRVIEGRLIEIFLKEGWKMEMERPAITPITNGTPEVSIDGVHLWANPSLT